MGFVNENLDHYLAQRVELINYATSIVGDRARGEDVVQEAFLRLTSSAANRSLKEPAGYLRRIVRNLALDWIRRIAFERKHFGVAMSDDAFVEDRPSQEMVLAHRQELRIVIAAMTELPDRTRIALEMHRFEGLKLKDIAAHFDISVALAHSLVFTALDHCRKRLAEKN